MSDLHPVRRALLSVYDKTGLVDLGRALAARDVELLSTGGSARTLREAGLAVKDVAEETGFPEMMDGRVKTLHPALPGGILARRDRPDDLAALERHGLGLVDVVIVNLYPFVKAAA
ncbi:MAG: bifunctional phosphoribosylaminoimidazolecarboxamide formyltransferase/IMP cyclohydrolase, partial [Planctomycetota bacterium]|nr:bifunctional phosphoribosylaminoimidazolecarboxamide formyltransferase/IMP cyclohydrolase [Planctomycetota bacterium]